MNKDKLLELREKIVQKAQQLAVEGQGSPADRLQVLLVTIQSGDASLEVLTAAYELIESIEGDDEKLTALLDVLYEVDARITSLPNDTKPEQSNESQSVVEHTSEQPSQEPQAQSNDQNNDQQY